MAQIKVTFVKDFATVKKGTTREINTLVAAGLMKRGIVKKYVKKTRKRKK